MEFLVQYIYLYILGICAQLYLTYSKDYMIKYIVNMLYNIII